MGEQIGSSPKNLRGLAKKTLALIDEIYEIAKAKEPITGRGIGYNVFTRQLIPSMSKNDLKPVYNALLKARERGVAPWKWIVDPTRELDRVSSWENPERFIACAARSYRRDLWQDQPRRVIVASEKATVSGILRPVLNDLGVGFIVLHGFSGATPIHDLAEDYDGRMLIILYIGDWDPSGMFMSEVDLPRRFATYGGDHVIVRRVALLKGDLDALPWFPVADKRKDPRYKWWTENGYGDRCWELDSMDPNALRDRVRDEIEQWIAQDAWERGLRCAAAEEESLQTFFDSWGRSA